jgi:hypothetical protein
LELEPKAQRYGVAKLEEATASQEASAADLHAKDAIGLATTSKSVMEKEMAQYKALDPGSHVLVSDLRAFLTPINASLDCDADARNSVENVLRSELSAAVPKRWDMSASTDYSREVDSLMAAPGGYEFFSRSDKAPQNLLLDCQREVSPKTVLARVMSAVDATCSAVSHMTILDEATDPVTGQNIKEFNTPSVQASIASACSDLKKLAPSHPLLREATSVSRFHEDAWNSIISASLNGRQALSNQLDIAATSAQASAAETTLKRDSLRKELAALQEPYREYQAELGGRKKREAAAEQIRIRAAALAAREHAVAEAKAAAEREKAWRASGNTGLSPDGRQACQQHFMTYSSLLNASQAVAMTQGADAAANFVIKEAANRGISMECLQYLRTQ